jgi:hypothetical protein
MRRGDTAAFRRIVDSMYTKGDSTAKSWALNRVFNLTLLDGKLSQWYQILSQIRPAPTASTPRQRLGWATARGDAWTTATWRRRPSDVEKRLDEAIAGYDGPLNPYDHLNIAVVYAYTERADKGRRFLARYQAEGQRHHGSATHDARLLRRIGRGARRGRQGTRSGRCVP